jgi:hypothetical protein
MTRFPGGVWSFLFSAFLRWNRRFGIRVAGRARPISGIVRPISVFQWRKFSDSARTQAVTFLDDVAPTGNRVMEE